MSMKKIIAGAMTIAVAASSMLALTGCNGGGMALRDGQYSYNFNMYVQDDTNYPVGVSSFDNFIKNKFGLVFNYDRIPRTDWETKTNTYFAIGDFPDVTTGGKEVNYKGWASEGLLTPLASSAEELSQKMPNYVKIFGDEWENVYNLAASSDGKLYYLPSLRQEKAQMCWLYRKDVFDEMGLEFPKTTDEFLEVCKKLKEKYPDKIIISSNGQKKSSLTGFFQAFGIPELILAQQSFYDPTTESFVPYGMTTDNAREMYKFLKELYDNNLIDREILSIEKDQFYSRCAQDNAFITYNYVYNAEMFTTKTNVNGKTGAVWAAADTMLTNDPERGTLFKKDPSYSDWGPAFSIECGKHPEKVDAILKYFDWTTTPEGQLYLGYGVEGESYNLVPVEEYRKQEIERVEKQAADGKLTEEKAAKDKATWESLEIPKEWIVERDGVEYVPVEAEGWYHQNNNPSGKKLSDGLGIMSGFMKHPKNFYEVRGKDIEELYQSFFGKMETDNYYHIDAVPMRYTTEEENQYTDNTTALGNKRDEYMARFLRGEMDPSNDKDWNQYISDMERVGLKDFEALQTTVYERTAAQLSK